MTQRAFASIIFLWALIGSTWCAPVPDNEVIPLLNKERKIAAFYNVYAEGGDFDSIVQNQVSTIKGSGLLDRLDHVFYATMGNAGNNYEIKGDKYTHIAHYGATGQELQTLGLLKHFCQSNPTSKVLYFHDKGSYHHSYANVKFCAVLNCYVLNPNCIDALDNHDTCGWRISPTPRVHYSGNFWWARCSYVNTLIDPMAPINNQTYIDGVGALGRCVGLDGRYFAESWIGTGINLHPADCMNSTIDNSYVWGYRFPFAADAYCHGPEIPSGLPCQTASTYENVGDFKNAINQMNSLISETECRDNRKANTKVAHFLYGEDPHTYLEWMDRLYAAEKLPEGTLVRFTDSTQVYLVKDGVLQGFPNLKTFIGMGKDFGDVKVLYASDRPGYSIGPMLPSY